MECITHDFHAMGTHCHLHIYARTAQEHQHIVSTAVAEIKRLEDKYTRYRNSSETSRINRSAGQTQGITVDTETARLLDYAATAYHQSDGLFDITSGILRKAWHFDRNVLPTQQDIEPLLHCVGWQQIHWEAPLLILPIKGMEIDFGGIVKEYAVDAITTLCQREGCQHGLLDMGGDISVIGPHPDGSPWRIGIRDPWHPQKAKAIIELTRGAIATSGDYERCMEIDGKRYGHILNPFTGWPVEGMVSVSVQAPHCIIAGTASTIAMLRGEQHGPTWLANLGLPYLCIHRDASLSGSFTPNT